MENIDEIKKLKEELEIRDNAVEHFRKEAIRWANIAKEYQKDKTKLEQILQEIKAIAENNIDCKQYEIDHDCFNDTRCKALRELIETLQQILDLITKAEEE